MTLVVEPTSRHLYLNNHHVCSPLAASSSSVITTYIFSSQPSHTNGEGIGYAPAPLTPCLTATSPVAVAQLTQALT